MAENTENKDSEQTESPSENKGILPQLDLERRNLLKALTIAGASASGVRTLTGEALGATLCVDPTDESCAYDTIQGAVKAANSGDIISVRPGTYRERVLINTSGLTITGVPGDESPGTGPEPPVLEGESNAGQAFRLSEGTSDILIEGFKIMNYGTGPDDRGTGVFASNQGTSNITIRDNFFSSFGWTAIFAFNSGDGGHDNWTVKRNIIERATWFGVEFTNTSNSIIKNNEIVGTSGRQDTSEDTGISGPNTDGGILLKSNSAGPDVTVSAVTIQGNAISGKFDGAGIWLGTQVPPRATDSGQRIVLKNIDIIQNELSGSRDGFGGIFLEGGGATEGLYESFSISDNQLSDFSNGIGFFGPHGEQFSSISIQDNIISNNDAGVRVFQDTSPNGVSVSSNDIFGNEDWGANNTGTDILDATENWWGAENGPSGGVEDPVTGERADGDGDKVSEDVKFDPWLRGPVRAVDLDLKDVRLVQIVDNTRSISFPGEKDDPGDYTPDIPNPGIISNRNFSVVFRLDGDNVEQLSRPVTVKVTQRRSGGATDSKSFKLTPSAVQNAISDEPDLSILAQLTFERLVDGGTYLQGQQLLWSTDVPEGEFVEAIGRTTGDSNIFFDNDEDGSIVVHTHGFTPDTYTLKDEQGNNVATFEIVESGTSTDSLNPIESGTYPVFGSLGETDSVNLSIKSADADDVHSEITKQKGSDFTVTPAQNINIGFVSITDLLAGVNYGSDGNGGPASYEETVSDIVGYLGDKYPTQAVNAYRHNSTVIGAVDLSLIDLVEADMRNARNELEKQLPISADENPIGGSIQSFDVTVAVVPERYFDYHGYSASGLHFGGSDDDGDNANETQPQESAAVIESSGFDRSEGAGPTGAHEIGHHFLGEIYPQSLAQPEDGSYDYSHLKNGTKGDELISTVFEFNDGSFDVDTGHSPFMQEGGARGTDSFTHQKLIDGQFNPCPPEIDGESCGISSTSIQSNSSSTSRTTVLSGLGGITDDGKIELVSLVKRPGRPAPSVQEADIEINSKDSDGVVLDSRGFSDTAQGVFSANDGIVAGKRVSFTIPFSEETYDIEFTVRDPELDGETTTTIQPLTQSLFEAVEWIPENGFTRRPDEQRRVLNNKLDDIEEKMDSQEFQDAKKKLKNDFRRMIQRWLKDDYEAAANEYTKQEMLGLVDDMIARVETLAQESS